MRRLVVGAILVAGCGREQPAPDSTRSMPTPVPSTGTTGAPGRSEREIFEFPKRARQDPTTLGVRTHQTLGVYMVDANERSLYSFSGDDAGQTACLTNCATVWPPATVERMPKEIDASIDASKLALTTRPDGTRQLSINGMPLYYAESDLEPGDIWGHFAMSFGGRFTLVSPAGKPLPAPR